MELRGEVSDSAELMNATINSMTSSPRDVTSANDSDVTRPLQVETIFAHENVDLTKLEKSRHSYFSASDSFPRFWRYINLFVCMYVY